MSDIEKTSENPIIFKASDLAKIYSGNNINLKINSKILYYERIAKLFKRNKISFESYTADVIKTNKISVVRYTPDVSIPKRFDIHFGNQSDFKDLFIIVAILKKFGLRSIYHSHDFSKKVIVGSYIAEYGHLKVKPVGLSTNKFLNLPFSFTTKELIQEYFNNNKIKTPDDDYNYNSYYYKRESYGQYAGSYAQDVEGLSDNFINDVLDGNPDAYWNID